MARRRPSASSRAARCTGRTGGIAAQLIIAGPPIAQRGSINRAYTTVMDLALTFLELAGATYPDDGSVRSMEGESMAALLAGDATTVHDADYVTTLFHAGRAFVRRGPLKLVTLEPPFDETGLELYDVESDPGETRDLAEARPEVYRESSSCGGRNGHGWGSFCRRRCGRKWMRWDRARDGRARSALGLASLT